MVTQLQKRVPIGIAAADALAWLNEAFRKLNQMSKGGFVWQIVGTDVTWNAGLATTLAPANFDPGKTAILQGVSGTTLTQTVIPYAPLSEFLNKQHLLTTQKGFFTAWSYYPTFTLAAPTSYQWTLILAPYDAIQVVPVTMKFFYHCVNFAPFASGANIYFPTPDQFDSLILDLAEAEVKRYYNISGWDKVAQQANAAVAEVIDTYRSDRFDLGGLFEVTAEAKEKQTERDR
jgi:hypothetical protein